MQPWLNQISCPTESENHPSHKVAIHDLQLTPSKECELLEFYTKNSNTDTFTAIILDIFTEHSKFLLLNIMKYEIQDISYFLTDKTNNKLIHSLWA